MNFMIRKPFEAASCQWQRSGLDGQGLPTLGTRHTAQTHSPARLKAAACLFGSSCYVVLPPFIIVLRALRTLVVV
jgi:hypothetical protein